MKRLIWLIALLSFPAFAEDFHRSPLPGNGFSYVESGEHWQGGQINWYYNPTNQPAALTTDQIVALFKTAAAKWEGMCNVKFNYMGTTNIAPNLYATWATIDRTNVFGWGVLTGNYASYDGYTVWFWDNGGNMADADMMLNLATHTWAQSNINDLEGLITHELGHVLGLQHSNVSASVMFAQPYHSFSYQRTLRGDDAQACAALYGASANAESNRLFNWVELASPYTAYFSPAVEPSATASVYYYRYYPTTNSYLGTTADGKVWYLGPNGGAPASAGQISDYFGQVTAAGF